MDKEFNTAAEKIKTLGQRPSDKILLKVYALYKQATVGPNKTSEPAFWDIKSKSKWEAWKAEGKLSQDDAKKKYIYLVNKLVQNGK